MKEIQGEYNNSLWISECPVKHCSKLNAVDPARSFRPVSRCEHFQQLKEPGHASPFIYKLSAKVQQETIRPTGENLYTLEIENATEYAGSVNENRFLISFKIRIGRSKKHPEGHRIDGFTVLKYGIGLEELDSAMLYVLRKADEMIKMYPGLKSVSDETNFTIFNVSYITKEKARSAFLKALTTMEQEVLLKEKQKKQVIEAAPEKPENKIPRKKQTDLFDFFSQGLLEVIE